TVCRLQQAGLFRGNGRAGSCCGTRPDIGAQKDESAASAGRVARRVGFAEKKRQTKAGQGRYRPALEAQGSARNPQRRSRACRFKRDRKSTRLNSSHLGISYAVFCLKKKKKKKKNKKKKKKKRNIKKKII